MRITRRSVLGNELPDYNINPPEYESPDEVRYPARIELTFNDVEVNVEPNGSWDYADYSWADGQGPRGKWVLEPDDLSEKFYLDRNEVIEGIDSIISPMMPIAPGTYYISGQANLTYDVIAERYPDTDEVYIHHPTIELNYDESSVDEFTYARH